jgi:hypothetical protein
MSQIFSVGSALDSLGIKEWTLYGEPSTEAEFLQTFAKITGVDENNHSILSTDPKDFGVTWDEIQAEITRLQADYEAKQYQRDRAAEYPSVNDYLDGIVKGDQAQIDAYIAACQAVKAKYPKPE